MQRPLVGVVGAGRVGSVIAARLRHQGLDVVVSARSAASRLRVETSLPGVGVLAPVDVARQADVLVLTVPDDELVRVTEELVAAGAIRAGQLVVHTSGRHGLAALEAATRVGARGLALHPAMTFTGAPGELGADAGLGCVFGLTAEPAERPAAAWLVELLGGTEMWIDEDQRVTYHAALAHGANHLVTLVAQAQDLLRSVAAASGTPGVDPADVLRPLLTAALNNALQLGDAALTGPVVRGDVTTVRAHADALAHAPADTRDSYLALARATTRRAQADGRLDADTSRQVRQVLREAEWDALAETALRV
ncbi:hypothetical protein ASD11_13400 [Aeromicrobium sp. Root495]|nr:hypothetical protein ASD11_13400 [Aeromicrobium sp. Root495]